jgi:hypothetical protein
MDKETNNGEDDDDDDDNNNNNNDNWNVKTNFVPIIIGTTVIISNLFRKYPNNIPGKHDNKELQKTPKLA